MNFEGTVEITVNIASPVKSITLNIASPLELHSAVLSHSALKTESTRPATKFDYNTKRERVTIHFAGGEIAAGQAKIGLRFTSILDSSMMGYYVSIALCSFSLHSIIVHGSTLRSLMVESNLERNWIDLHLARILIADEFHE